jgi:hypothetical protein
VGNPHLVNSQKGRYCHIFFRPTLSGFRADAAPDTVESVVFDTDSAEAYARANGTADGHSVRLIPVPPDAVAGSDWRRIFVTGHIGSQPVLLRTRAGGASGLTQPPDKLPLREAVSTLPWDAKDLLFVRDPRDPSRTVVLFGDRLRDSWKGVREEEKGYLLRAEFGVTQAHHVRTGTHWLSELLSPGSLGSINVTPLVNPHDLANLQHELAKLGFQITQGSWEAPVEPPPVAPASSTGVTVETLRESLPQRSRRGPPAKHAEEVRAHHGEDRVVLASERLRAAGAVGAHKTCTPLEPLEKRHHPY